VTIPVGLHGIRLQRDRFSLYREIAEDRTYTMGNQLTVAMGRIREAAFEVDDIADAIQDGEFEQAFQNAEQLSVALERWFPEGLEPAP
jgi:hypothetical protein